MTTALDPRRPIGRLGLSTAAALALHALLLLAVGLLIPTASPTPAAAVPVTVSLRLKPAPTARPKRRAQALPTAPPAARPLATAAAPRTALAVPTRDAVPRPLASPQVLAPAIPSAATAGTRSAGAVMPLAMTDLAPALSATAAIEPTITPPPLAVSTPEPEPTPALPEPPTPRQEADYRERLLGLFAQAKRYPSMSRRRGEAGEVRLSLMVEADGRVSELQVLRSSGFSRLDAAATAMVRRCEPLPAPSRPGRIEFSVMYQLQDP